MAGGRFGNGPPRQVPQEATATLAVGISSLWEEGPMGSLPAASGKILDAVRTQLEGCRIMNRIPGNDGSGISVCANADGTATVYATLPKNLRGVGSVTADGTIFLIGKTRSSWFLLYGVPPASLYENPAFMSINLRRCDILTLGNGKTRYLSRVSRDEINALIGIASSSARIPAETLAPQPGMNVPIEALAAKLKKAESVQSDDLFFNMGAFAEGIRFAAVLQDASGNPYYYIISGEQERPYWLYVNTETNGPEGSMYPTRFRFNADSCIMFREE